MTLSKNTARAVKLKFSLFKVFSAAREELAANADYLPSYREAHDKLAELVKRHGSSVPEVVITLTLKR